MLKIKFQGSEYVFTGESLDEDGAIAKQDDYENGRLGFAHLMTDGNVFRHGEVVGHRDDIEIIGSCDPKVDINSLRGILFDPSWNQRFN